MGTVALTEALVSVSCCISQLQNYTCFDIKCVKEVAFRYICNNEPSISLKCFHYSIFFFNLKVNLVSLIWFYKPPLFLLRSQRLPVCSNLCS